MAQCAGHTDRHERMKSDASESAGEELVNDAIELLLCIETAGADLETGGINGTLNDTDAQMPSPRAQDPRRTVPMTVPRRQKRGKQASVPCRVPSCHHAVPTPIFPSMSGMPPHTTYTLTPTSPSNSPTAIQGRSCQCVGRIVSYKCLRSSPRRIAYYSLGIVNRRTDRARPCRQPHSDTSC